MSYLSLYITFFRIGLFTIGGGLAALPLLHQEALSNNWLSESVFADMIAVSQSTPGPIGINMATYVGFSQLGIWGSIVATLGMVSPSIIIICIIARFLKHFNEHPLVQAIMSGIRPAVVGIILAAAYKIALIALLNTTNFKGLTDIPALFNYKSLILFALFMFATNKWKHHPFVYILLAGVIGIFIY